MDKNKCQTIIYNLLTLLENGDNGDIRAATYIRAWQHTVRCEKSFPDKGIAERRSDYESYLGSESYKRILARKADESDEDGATRLAAKTLLLCY